MKEIHPLKDSHDLHGNDKTVTVVGQSKKTRTAKVPKINDAIQTRTTTETPISGPMLSTVIKTEPGTIGTKRIQEGKTSTDLQEGLQLKKDFSLH
jgi:hypothetical protein